jgi:hypothetical protein
MDVELALKINRLVHNECKDVPHDIGIRIEELVRVHQSELKNIGVLANVSGMLPLTENAKEKLEYINGNCIARDFPNEQPTKQWAGAVLDLLEELGLGNYR